MLLFSIMLQSESSFSSTIVALFVTESKLQPKQEKDGMMLLIGTPVNGCIFSMIFSASSIYIALQ